MKRLCFSTLVRLLVICKNHSSNQRKLCSDILTSLPNVSDIGHDDSNMSNLVHGKKNLGDDILDAAQHCDTTEYAATIKTKVISQIKSDYNANIVLAIKDILQEDTAISDDTEVEKINGMTKGAVLQRDSFVFHELIAGLLLYTILVVPNRGTGASAKAITADYLTSFDQRSGEIALIPSYSEIHSLPTRDIQIDAKTMLQITESGGACLCCGKSLAAMQNGKAVNRGKLVTIYQQEVLLCAECACVAAEMSDDEKTALLQRQNELKTFHSATEAVETNVLPEQLEAVLVALGSVDTSWDSELRHEPVRVDKKIHKPMLMTSVRSMVLHYYDGLNDILDRLASENVLNVTRFARQIRRMYEDAAEHETDEGKIFRLLSNQLYMRTGRQYPEACDVIIACFVQRCEVFDAFAE